MSPKPKVLLTGGSGFIAAHILEQLLQKGYRVVTTVRSEEKAQKILGAHPGLSKDELEVAVVGDIARPEAFDEVAKTPGIELVLHTASPFHFNFDDPAELLGPAVVGTTSILKALARSAPAVKRVVVTSSFAAILDEDAAWDGSTTFSEASWNPVTAEDIPRNANPKSTAYRASKKLAEKAAWDFVNEGGAKFDLVTVCPPLVLGPVVPHFASLESVNTSNERIVDLLQGRWKAAGRIPETGLAFIWVDVRDVAEAHIAALERPEAGGKRLFTTAGPFSNRGIFEVVRRRFPEYADKMPAEDVEGGREVDEAKRYKVDKSATDGILGIKWRSFEDSVVDAVNSFKAAGA